MAQPIEVCWLGGGSGPLEVSACRQFGSESRHGASVLETPDGRWVLMLDAPNRSTELEAHAAARTLLNFGYNHLPPRLLRALEAKEEGGNSLLEPAPLPNWSGPPVILRMVDEEPLVMGVPVAPLHRVEHGTIKVLIVAGPQGLTLSQLESRAYPIGDPKNAIVRILRRPEWQPVLHMAGRDHKRYRIAAPA